MESRVAYLALAIATAIGLFSHAAPWIYAHLSLSMLPVFFKEASETAASKYALDVTFIAFAMHAFELFTTASEPKFVSKLAKGPLVAQFALGASVFVPLAYYFNPVLARPTTSNALEVVASASAFGVLILLYILEQTYHPVYGFDNSTLFAFLVLPIIPPLFVTHTKRTNTYTNSFLRAFVPAVFAIAATLAHFRDLAQLSQTRAIQNTIRYRFKVFGEPIVFDFSGYLFREIASSSAVRADALATWPARFLVVEAISLYVVGVLKMCLEVSRAHGRTMLRTELAFPIAGVACIACSLITPHLLGPIAPFCWYLCFKEILTIYPPLKRE